MWVKWGGIHERCDCGRRSRYDEGGRQEDAGMKKGAREEGRRRRMDV